MTRIRVATAQYESDENTDANLEALLTLADQAAQVGADLVHFPEFCNHPVWYENRDHAWQAATAPGDEFVGPICDFARAASMYVSFNATTRGQYPTVFAQNHLIGRDGELLIANRKQVLMYHEADFFVASESSGAVAETDFGLVGLMSCMDGLIPETVRCLVVDGADLVLNSLSSNALDEAHLHIPVRAAENGVFVVSANRVGRPVSNAAMPMLEAMTGMTPDRLMGGGESQIVGPDGTVLARASRIEPEIVYADIDLSTTTRRQRLGPRRPSLYAELATPPEGAAGSRPPAAEVTVAAVTTDTDDVDEIIEVCASTDAQLLVLPELSGMRRPTVVDDCQPLADAGARLIDALEDLCNRRGRWVVAGVVRADGDRFHNCAVLIDPSGELVEYRQTHVHPSDDWATPGSEFVTCDLPFGRVGLLVGLDLSVPETARVLALRGAHLIACPTTWRAEWEADLGCVERSAENHVSVVCAARADGRARRPSTILTIPTGYPFPETGEVNAPVRISGPVGTGVVTSALDLRTSDDKRLMGRTDLIADARPDLYATLVGTTVANEPVVRGLA